MGQEIKSFINGFTQGAGIGLAYNRDRREQERADQRDTLDPSSNPELQEFDRINGTGTPKKRGLLARAGTIIDNWGGSNPAPVGGGNRSSRIETLDAPSIAAPAVSDGAEWGQGVDAYYEDGGLVSDGRPSTVMINGRPTTVMQKADGSYTPMPEATPVDIPELPPRDWKQDPIYSAPMNVVPENRIIGRGAISLNDGSEYGPRVTPEGNSPTAVAPTEGGGAAPVGAGPGGKPVANTVTARKPLRDQTRTEAFDPELDKDDPDNVVSKMLSGGMQFANNAFHLSGDGVAVGDDPNKVKGQRAFLQGVGAAEQGDVDALNKIALQQNPDLDKAALAMKRMEIIYRHYVTTGQTDKANKVAFELLQYGAGEAARMGGQALKQFKSGDHKGAVTTLVQAVDDIPDGNTAKVNGNNVVLTNGKGQVVNTIPITPENIFNYALGLSNKSMYWQVIANRAAITSTAMQKANATEGKSAVDAARISLMQAREAKIRGGGGGGKGGGAVALPPELKNALTAIEGVPTSEVTPGGKLPEQGGGEAPLATGEEDLDADGEPIEQGDNPSAAPGTRVATGYLKEKRGNGLPTYDEPHPLVKWKGKNPYSEVLSNPKFTAYFATKEGKAARSLIEARAREKNKEVTEYAKAKREFERAARKDAQAADKEDLAEYKGIHNQKDKSKEAGELFDNIKMQLPDVQKEYEGADPSVFNTNIVKPTKLVDTAQSLATSNPNMPPNKALRIIGALTRAGTEDGEAELKSYHVHGTDRLGNFVVSPKSNPQQMIYIRPDAYNEIETMRKALHSKIVGDKKKPTFFKKVGDVIANPPKGEPLPQKIKAKPRVIGEEPAVDLPPPVDRPVNLRIR